MSDDKLPAEVGSSAMLGPVGWRYVPSKVWGDYVLTQDPAKAQLARDVGRDVEPLYTGAQLATAVAAEREQVRVPTSAAEAKAMATVAIAWMREHAPDDLQPWLRA